MLTYATAPTPSAHAAWSDLPPLPEAVAGQCVGVSAGWLLVAGGSLWSAPPWDGGVKTWSDRVYGLQPGAPAWKLVGTLPRAMGYGAGAQHGDSLLCAGGQNASEVFRDVLRLRISAAGRLVVETLPPLPMPLTNAAAAVSGNHLFLFGGQNTLDPAGTAKNALQLDLRHEHNAWQLLRTPWAHARILPAAAGCADGVFVGGGADLSAGADGAPVRAYLTDAWHLDTRQRQWRALPALPAATTAAPSACGRDGDWLIFGGDDGALALRIQQLRDTHPGFRTAVLRYHPAARQWQADGDLPVSLVTTGAALWNGRYVIAGGENQPGHRSSRTIQATAAERR